MNSAFHDHWRQVQSSVSSRGMRSLSLLFIGLLLSPATGAETMLEQARLHGAAVGQGFIDDPTHALPKVPWTTETRAFGMLGVAVDRSQWGVVGGRDDSMSVGVTGQMRHFKLEQPLLAGMWGQSWGIRLNANAGADKAGLLAYGDAEAEFGTIATIAERGHGIYLRFSAQMSMLADPKYSSSIGLGSIPFGLRWDLGGGALELGAVPALGWVTVSDENRHVGTGPLLMGGEARLLSKAGWLEVQHLRAVNPAHARTTLLSACAQQGQWALCADGGWIELSDLSNGAEARAAHMGLHFGMGTFNHETRRSSRVALTPWR